MLWFSSVSTRGSHQLKSVLKFKCPLSILIQKNLCTPIFIAPLFTIAKLWKQPKFPLVNEWIKRQWYIYTMEYHAAEIKKELPAFTTA